MIKELLWTVLISSATVFLTAVATLDEDKITDWKVWAVGVAFAAAKATATATLALIARWKLSKRSSS